MRYMCFVAALATAAALLASVPPSVANGNGDDKKDEKKDGKEKEKLILPMALLTFEERGTGAKDMGAKVTDLLFAKLVAKPDLFMVDRADLKKVLEEQALSLTGAVKADEAVKVGQLTGAKLLVTGSVVQVEKKLYLVAKVISSETGRVAGASAEGALTDDLGALAGKLADAIDDTITKQGEKLVPRPVPVPDRIAGLNKRLAKFPRPTLAVQVSETAVQTELGRFARGAGFDLTDAGKGDVVISGTGVSEVVGRAGGLVSARARVELKVVDRNTGNVLALDSQTAVAVDLSDSIAGKLALQDAAGQLAERLLPRIAAPEPKK